MLDVELASHLIFALKYHSEKVEAFTLGQLIPNTDDVVRQNDKRPANMKIYIPDDIAKNLKGIEGLQDGYIFMRIPREVIQEHDKLREEPPVIVNAQGEYVHSEIQ